MDERRGRAVSPVAASSVPAIADHGRAPRASNISAAVRRWGRPAPLAGAPQAGAVSQVRPGQFEVVGRPPVGVQSLAEGGVHVFFAADEALAASGPGQGPRQALGHRPVLVTGGEAAGRARRAHPEVQLDQLGHR